MYSEVFEVDPKINDKDFLLPIGKAKVMREGIPPFIVQENTSLLLLSLRW